MMYVYLIVLVLKPTEKQRYDEGAVPTVITGPHPVVAESETQAVARAMRFLPAEMEGKEDRIDVFTLPFVRTKVG